MCFTKGYKTKITYAFILGLIVFLDQLTKMSLLSKIGLGNTESFLPGIVQFTLVQNTGGAFSVLTEYPIVFKVIGVINIFVFSFFTFYPAKFLNNAIRFGSVFVLGGTIGNLIDRFLHNGVIDFIDLQLFDFAIFNVADIAINIGVAFVLYGFFCKSK